MNDTKWRLLQLFAGEGTGGAGGDGGGEGAASGDNSVDAGQQRLLELGVPADKIRKRSNRTASRPTASTTTNVASEDTAAPTQKDDASKDTTPTEDTTKARMSWDEIMKDPEYNKQMQAVVQSRLKSAKGAEETLGKLAPALEVLARKHNLDVENMDYDALAKAISDDDAYYEDKALEMGVPVETAKKIDQQERETARVQKEQARNLEQQRLYQHFASLESQASELKKVFPSFDLRTELQNPVFARMTHPNVGISVEDAYHAVHRKEIMSAGMQVTAQQTAKKISNAIQAGSRRPDENGTSGRSSSVTTFDYSKASREQREDLKRQIREAAARGEKLYPGR